MSISWKLGRVAGIDLFLHPTFLLLLAYVGLAEGGLPAVLMTSAVFGCVLLHELGHALMARRFGIDTVDITLYPIGGVARLERMPRAPGVELLIALAGPAVNLVIVAALWLSGGLFDAAGPNVVAFVSSLLLANLILALFNLIPAFPMDGGRVLRALLSGWLGRVRATTIAAGIGRVLAVAFGLFCLSRGLMMPAVLAAFIYFAAGGELARVIAEERTRFARPTPPPGFRWFPRGDGTWRLDPLVIPVTVEDRPRPWR